MANKTYAHANVSFQPSKNEDFVRGATLTEESLESKLSQVELELASLRLENRNLVAQVNQLQHELLQTRRIRTLIKLLAKAVDTAIITRIRRLNTTRMTGQAKQTLVVSDSKDADVVLKALRMYDLRRYYTLRSGNRLIYRVVFRAYVLASRSIFRLVLRLRRMARKG
jgi:triphosphoribosyl-dephospho-CoA synthetase